MKQLLCVPWNRVELIQFKLGGKVCGVRLVACLKESKVLANRAAPYCSSPKSIVFPVVGSKFPGGFAFSSNAVLHVLGIRGLSEICNSVVRALSVYVVDLVGRPNSVNIKPSEPMSKVLNVVNSDDPVASAYLRPCNLSYAYPSIEAYSACKYASVRVVIEKFAQACCGKIGLNHDVVPQKQLIGEKPRSVSALSGLRYFTGQPSNLQHAIGV